MQMVLLAALAARTTNALTAQVAPKAAVISEHRFRQLCEAAVRCGRPVEMQGRRVALTDTFRVMRQDELTIHGPGRIDGSGHSVFQIEGNGNTLTLRDLGRLESMRIGHAGHGLDQSWGLERVTVRVEARDETTVFEYGKVIDKHIPYEDAGRTGSKHGWRGVTIAGAAQAKLGQTTLVQLNVIGCTKLRKADKFGKSDPYVVVVVDGKRAGQTEVIQDDQNPRWGEADGLGEPIDVTVHERSVVTVAVYDADGDADVGDGLPDGDDDHLGEVVLTGAQICALPEHDDDGGHAILELQPGDNHKASGSIELSRE